MAGISVHPGGNGAGGSDVDENDAVGLGWSASNLMQVRLVLVGSLAQLPVGSAVSTSCANLGLGGHLGAEHQHGLSIATCDFPVSVAGAQSCSHRSIPSQQNLKHRLLATKLPWKQLPGIWTNARGPESHPPHQHQALQPLQLPVAPKTGLAGAAVGVLGSGRIS